MGGLWWGSRCLHFILAYRILKAGFLRICSDFHLDLSLFVLRSRSRCLYVVSASASQQAAQAGGSCILVASANNSGFLIFCWVSLFGRDLIFLVLARAASHPTLI